MANVKGIDNRGTEEVPFGYVYVDDTRVGFSQSDGVWPTNGWHSSPAQQRAASDFLDTQLAGWNSSVKVDD